MSGGGRTIGSYLLLPRPKDSVKWWIFPLTFAVGALGRGGVGGHAVIRAAVVWFALEILIYQARYQWNDIRGFAADQRHPDAASRGRLPGPPERAHAHLAASRATAALRVFAAAALGLVLPGLHLLAVIAVLVVAVFGVAFGYEQLRAHGTGRSGDASAPPTRAVVGIWLVIGGGYAVRGVSGLALAVPLTAHPALALAAVVTMWAFGTAFVTARWALEALAFAERGGDGLVWRVRADQAREHLLALTRWLPAAGAEPPRSWRALREPTAASAPWNAATLVCALGAGATGALLVDPGSAGVAVIAAIAATALSVAVLRAPAAFKVAAVAAASVCMVCALWLAGSPRPLVAAVPWLVATTALLYFRTQSLATMGAPRLPRRPVDRVAARA
jgi:hypothetical protein